MSLQGAQALPCIPGRSIHTAPVPRRAVSCELSPHAPSPGPARRALPSQCHEAPQTPGHVWQLGTGSRCPMPGIGRSLGPGGRSRGLSRLHPSGPGAVTAAGWLLFRSRHQRDDKRHRASLQRHLRGVQHPREPAALEGEPAHPWLFPAPQCCQGLGRAAGAAGPRTALERPPCPGRAPPHGCLAAPRPTLHEQKEPARGWGAQLHQALPQGAPQSLPAPSTPPSTQTPAKPWAITCLSSAPSTRPRICLSAPFPFIAPALCLQDPTGRTRTAAATPRSNRNEDDPASSQH